MEIEDILREYLVGESIDVWVNNHGMIKTTNSDGDEHYPDTVYYGATYHGVRMSRNRPGNRLECYQFKEQVTYYLKITPRDETEPILIDTNLIDDIM